MKKKFKMLIGLPRSGKSTYCKKCIDAIVISTNQLREELYGDMFNQSHNEEVFGEATKRIVHHLQTCTTQEVILDATNIKLKDRTKILTAIDESISPKLYKKEAVWFVTPYEVCLDRNRNCFHVIDESIIRQMYTHFVPPHYREGFTKIELYFSDTDITNYTIENFLKDADKFDQQNPYHKLTLGGHCRAAAKYVQLKNASLLVQLATLLHDNGKPFTASYLNGKGVKTDYLHYYQHHSVGAYNLPLYIKNSVFYNKELTDKEIIQMANLIYYHMHPLIYWNQEEKFKCAEASFESHFFRDLMLLHEGDRSAH